MEKISIIVPIYNAEKTINRCIDSLLKQTYKNIEIILINDGSIDNSLLICKNYAAKDKRVVVINKSNGGVSSARNAGIVKVSGNYIMFCDSDDYVYDNWCEEMYKMYKDNYLIMCGYNMIKDKKIINSIIPKSISKIVDKNKVMELENYGFFSPFNKLYNAKIIKNNNIYFDSNLNFGEDLIFNLSYLMHISKGVLLVDKALYAYDVTNDESLSKVFTINLIDQIYYFYKQVKELMKKIGINDIYQEKILHNHVYNDIERYIYDIVFTDCIDYHKKIKVINYILNSDTYQECIKDIKFINLIYKFCSLRKDGRFIYFFYKIRDRIKNNS